jgi:hypothetical protein
MQPIIQNKTLTMTTPRKILNSTEQTIRLMELKISQNGLHMIMNDP